MSLAFCFVHVVGQRGQAIGEIEPAESIEPIDRLMDRPNRAMATMVSVSNLLHFVLRRFVSKQWAERELTGRGSSWPWISMRVRLTRRAFIYLDLLALGN